MRISSSIIHDRNSTKKLAAYKSLIDVQGSVGLLLYDVVEALRLPPRQQRAILGMAM
jgi:hypothetical protein